MQTLYYTSASASLLVRQDNNTSQRWDYISSLIVCSSLQEIIAFSGSQQLLAFPIANTSIVYSDKVQQATYAPPPGIPTAASTSVFIYFNLLNVPTADTASCYYYISASSFYFTGSGQTTQASFAFPTNQECKVGVEGINNYTASVTLYNTSQYSNIPGVPGTVIGSELKLDSEVYIQTTLTGSNNYQAVATIFGTAALP